ncbi:hypothetical protein M569_17366 [Genlisea aurea]|uniref:SPX domain-containing protein n=1 Tax=Genlisea aurea TaxID=192259 RepID=S8BZ69_9LAMI|nr:hypothetical protein M569_17366 [Genlisea aurea]
MKFGKSLSNQIEETLPEWRDKFLSYKELKKRLKLIQSCDGLRTEKRRRIEDCGRESVAMTEEESDFVRLLEDELEKFNAFFVEKEEEYIIRLKELQDRLDRAKDSNDEMITIRREIVDFHGEMVLLENYSALNYTGLVKILKKYDKRTGALLRLPFIQKVLQEPFFTIDLLYKLVKECERMLDRMFPALELPSSSSASEAAVDGSNDSKPSSSSSTTAPEDDLTKASTVLADLEHMKSTYMKSSLVALRVLKEIRSGSSTVSAFSLPPLMVDDAWNANNNNVPVLEQAAK